MEPMMTVSSFKTIMYSTIATLTIINMALVGGMGYLWKKDVKQKVEAERAKHIKE